MPSVPLRTSVSAARICRPSTRTSAAEATSTLSQFVRLAASIDVEPPRKVSMSSCVPAPPSSSPSKLPPATTRRSAPAPSFTAPATDAPEWMATVALPPPSRMAIRPAVPTAAPLSSVTTAAPDPVVRVAMAAWPPPPPVTESDTVREFPPLPWFTTRIPSVPPVTGPVAVTLTHPVGPVFLTRIPAFAPVTVAAVISTPSRERVTSLRVSLAVAALTLIPASRVEEPPARTAPVALIETIPVPRLNIRIPDTAPVTLPALTVVRPLFPNVSRWLILTPSPERPVTDPVIEIPTSPLPSCFVRLIPCLRPEIAPPPAPCVTVVLR